MRTLVLLLFITALSTASIASPDYNKLWSAANRNYQLKQYDSAAYYYEQVAAAKPTEAVIYFNLGNTYYRLNDIGKAVLNYERALQINPSYKEAKENLLLTQSRIVNRIPTIPDIFFVAWWKSVTDGNKAGIWAILSIIAFLLLIGTLAARRMGKLQNTPPQLTIGLSIVWMVLLSLAFFSAKNKITANTAVVMRDDTPFMRSPKRGQPISTIPEGTVVKLKNKDKGWIETELPDGRTGWIRDTYLEKI